MEEESLPGTAGQIAVGHSTAGDASPPRRDVEDVPRPAPTDHGRELGTDQFAALLRCLAADRERAWTIYAGVRERLTRFFAEKNCRSPVECADDTLDRAARRLTEGAQITTADPYSYILGIAYNVLREYWKSRERGLVELETLTPALHPAHDPASERDEEEARSARERRLDCLTHCLAQLPPEQRTFLDAYHTGAQGGARIDGRRRLAAELGIELNALRIRACRVRDRLSKCLRACLAQGGGAEI